MKRGINAMPLGVTGSTPVHSVDGCATTAVVTVGAPWGLVLALAALPVVAAYFFRRRQPPRVVSALFLWRVPSPRAEAGPRFERFNRQASLLLELTAVLAATLFVADVRCGAAPQASHWVVVVDGSLSMRAQGDGVSVVDRVRQAVAAAVSAESVAALTIVESGPRPRIIAGPMWEASRAQAALEAWEPSQPWHEPAAALQLARDLAGPQGTVSFFTDAPLVPVPRGVAVQALGRPADNRGFVSASRRDAAGAATVTVQVTNFSDQPAALPVEFKGGDEVVVEQLALAAGATATVRARLSTPAPITVSLPDDALVHDGRLVLHGADEKPLRVELLQGLDEPAKAALQRFFSVAEGVTLDSPGDLSIGPPDAGASIQLGAVAPLRSFVGPFFARAANPLLDDVHLGGVVWTAGSSPGGLAVVRMGETVMLAEDEASGQLTFNLDVARSTVQRAPAWPVLWGNVVRWAAARRPGFARHQVAVGDGVQVTTDGRAEWTLRHEDGHARRVSSLGTAVVSAVEPGRWSLLRDGTAIDGLDVMPLDSRESDLRSCGSDGSTVRVPTAVTSPDEARPTWALVALLLALVGDAWLQRRVMAPSQ